MQGSRVLRAAAAVGGAATLLASAMVPANSATTMQVAMMQGADACVALTFDDGPDATLTPKLLSVLESKNAVATCFVVGSRVKEWPDPVAREATDGDEVGNHSWDHPALPSLSSPAALSELTRTDDVISQVIGHVPDVTRAPYGSMSSRIASLSDRTYVAWNIDTLDWEYPDVDRITRSALQATNGSIILMHDIHPRTIDAVPGIIDGLRQRGFRLVTVGDLLSGSCGGKPLAYGLPFDVAPSPAPVATASGGSGTPKPAAGGRRGRQWPRRRSLRQRPHSRPTAPLTASTTSATSPLPAVTFRPAVAAAACRAGSRLAAATIGASRAAHVSVPAGSASRSWRISTMAQARPRWVP